MNRYLFPISICYICFFLIFCDINKGRKDSNENKPINNILCIQRNSTYIIDKEIDLHGEIVNIPDNVTLLFKNGSISNGKLNGNNTRIDYNGTIFSNLIISGSWIVPEIKSSMFADINKDNVLINLFALTNSKIYNHVLIEPGEYWLKVTEGQKNVLLLSSNLDCEIDGIINLRPNDSGSYSIIYIDKSENVMVHGNGTLKGDKYEHLGKEGQWGIGVKVMRSKSVSIRGLNICRMWGDCVYIGGNSQNIVVDGCVLTEGRRQGISITSGKDILIKNCHINNISGHNPEYAIDVEPNKNCTIDNVRVHNVEVKGSKGGFKVSGYANNAHVGTITYKGCKVDISDKRPFQLSGCDKIVIQNCKVSNAGKDYPVWCKLIGNIVIDTIQLPTQKKDMDFKFINCNKRNIHHVKRYGQ